MGQYKITGKVDLCEDFHPSLTLKGHLTYKYDRKRNKSLDTLKADIQILKSDTVLDQTSTDNKGYFEVCVDSIGSYSIKASMGYYFNSKKDIEVKTVNSTFQVCISDTVYRNRYLNKIPVSSKTAKEDIREGKFYKIELSSEASGCSLSFLEFLDPEEIKNLESKYGFEHRYIHLEEIIPNYYLDIRQKEYNDLVFHHLDSVNQIHTYTEFTKEVIKMVAEKRKH